MMTLLAQTLERASVPSSAQAAATRRVGVGNPQPETFVLTPRRDWAEGATKRFLGAFVGGLVGLAIPAAIAGAGIPPCTIGLCGFATIAGLAMGISGPLSMVGANLGFTLMGGNASVGASAAGLLGGLGSGLVLLLISTVTTSLSNESQWAAVISAGALAAAIQALALEARNDALDEAPFLAAPTSRLAFTSLGMVATLGAGALLTALTLPFGYYAIIIAPIVLLVTAGLAPLVPWSIHRSMGGEGSLGAAYLGWLASLGVGAAGVFAAFLGATIALPAAQVDARTVGLIGGGLGLALIAGVMGTPLMLEWSHGESRLGRAKVVPDLKAQVSVAPIASPQGLAGGALALSGTF